MDSFQESSSPVDVDDNAFYQELTRQILMLTDEDDDNKDVHSNDVAEELTRMPMLYGGFESRPMARSYHSWWETGVHTPVPSWMEIMWANGGGCGGTGVFIPATTTGHHSKKSARRRNNHKVTKSNDKGRVYSTVGQKITG